MGVFDDLKERGMLAQSTNEAELENLLNNGKVTFYIGFDPTADSLHVGHFLQIMVMARMQKAGHRPIAIMGGGTGMIGDPSGKSDMRKMLTKEQISHNIECFTKQMSGLVDFSDGKALIVNNADWLLELNYVDFIREIGVHFTVNRMLAAECFKIRYEKGLTFLEFNYMLMQAYDFYRLYKEHGCLLELGGDDQWSNILAGVDLIRRKEAREVYGMTFRLLTTSDGKKMGKTEKGAVWLDPEKTPPYEFFQYWRNIDDGDVVNCMKMLTFLTLEEVSAYEKLEGSALNAGKEKLAYELTKLIHGEAEAQKALEAARALFAGGQNSENMPTTRIGEENFADGKISVIDLMVLSGLAPSRGEAKRLIQQGGISLREQKVEQFDLALDRSDFEGEVIMKKGKKIFHKFIL